MIEEDTIFPRILSIRWTELSLYSLCAELSLAYTKYKQNSHLKMVNFLGWYWVCVEIISFYIWYGRN